METQTKSLDQLLGDEPAAAPTLPAKQEAPPPAPAMGDKPQAAAPPADATASEPDPYANSPTVPRKALEDERRKRQDLDRKVREYEAIVQQRVQQPQQPQPQPQSQPDPLQQLLASIPDPLTDPDGYKMAMVNLQHWQFNQWQQDLTYRQFVDRVESSQEEMREAHPDYDQVEALFVEAAKEDPSLAAKMQQHRKPAKFAYEEGLKYRKRKEIGDDPEAFIESQVQARLAALGVPSSPVSPPPSKAPVPKSLATARSAAPRDERGRFAEGPKPLHEIFDD